MRRYFALRLRRWHASAGVCAALFFLALLLSGIALNHSETLALPKRKLSAPALSAWYGLRASTPAYGYRLDAGVFASDAQTWVLNTRVIAERAGPALGVVSHAGIVYIATRASLHLHLPTGDLVEKVSAATLPGTPLKRIGIAAGEAMRAVVVETAAGTYASADGGLWHRYTGEVRWSEPVALPQQTRSAIAPHFTPHITLERLLLDLHSGRILGRYGPWLVDLIAVVLGLLALSGTWLYFRLHRHRAHR